MLTFAHDATGALTAYCPAAQVTLFGGGTPCDPAATSGRGLCPGLALDL